MAGGLGLAFDTALMELIFNNTNVANVGDATGLRGSSSAGSFYLSIHTGTLDKNSTQQTNECAYTSYARVAVVRTAGGWTISGSGPVQAVNAAQIDFPKCTGGSETATYAAIGTSSSGAGQVLFWAPLLSPLAISNNITPYIQAGSAVFTMV